MLMAVLAWTSIAAGIFAPAAGAHAAALINHLPHSNSRTTNANQHSDHLATGAHHATMRQHAAGTTGVSAQSASPESICVASCLDTIAAKLAPPPHDTIAPDTSDATQISWPLLALVQVALPRVADRPWATGPPAPRQWERSGVARLVRANARLRI